MKPTSIQEVKTGRPGSGITARPKDVTTDFKSKGTATKPNPSSKCS